MYKKTCPFCKGDSYSASSLGKWICPYCQADLTDVISRPSGCGRKEEEEGVAGKVVQMQSLQVD